MKIYTKHQSASPSSFFFSLLLLPFRLLFNALKFIVTFPAKILPHRLMRKLNSTQRLFLNMVVVATLLIFGVWIYTSFVSPEQTKAAWFDSSWPYRMTVPITNTGTTLTNAQIPIATDTASLVSAGKMRSDCRDVRVTTQTGKVLKQWIHQCNTATTRIYVFVDQVPDGTSNLYLYYGNSTASQNTEVKTGTPQFPGISCKTILDHNDSSGNGTYQIDPNAGSPSDTFTAYCDMTTDSGGWTIVNSSNGTINQQPLTSDTEVTGNPFSNESSNIANSKKESISTVSAESLFKRSTGVWLKANIPIFDGNLTKANQHPHNTGVTLTANDGTTVSTAVAGYSNYLNSGGGDYGITTSVGFDHHNTSIYYHLRSGCTSHYLYRYGSTYNVNTALGSWAQTTACTNNSTSMGPWYAAMRGTNTPLISNISISSPLNEEQSPGPLAYWKFDEGQGTTTYDSTETHANGTITSATWAGSEQCVSGKCLSFNGSSARVSLGDRFDFTNQAPFTLQLWVNPTDTVVGTWRRIISKEVTDGNGRQGLILYQNSGTSQVCLEMWRDGSSSSACSSSSLPLNTWTFVTGTYDGSTLKVYFNGIQKASGASVKNLSNTSAVFSIGSYSGGNSYFKGKLDDVKIYPYARSSDQVKIDYNSRGSTLGTATSIGAETTSTLTNGLVAYWKMDESSWNGTSGEVVDSSGNANNGTAVSGTEATPSAKFGNAGYFAGNDEAISVPDSTSLDLGDTFTIALWSKRNTTGVSNYLLQKGAGPYAIGFNASNQLYLDMPGTGSVFTSTSSYTDTSSWHHIVFAKKGASLYVYYDGAVVAGTFTNRTLTDNSSALYLGSNSGNTNSRYAGNMDEVRLYNRQLSPNEILTLYNFAPGPVAYYDFEETSRTSVNDKSGNGYTGTLTNGPTRSQGKFGGGISFDGSNDYIDTGTNFATDMFTIGAWVYPTKSGTAQAVISNARDCCGTYNGFALETSYTGNNPQIKLWKADGSGSVVAGGGTVDLNKWNYLVGTYDGTSLKFYKNGTLVATTTTYAGLIGTPSFNLRIGSHGSGCCNFGGKLDNVIIYNYARTPGQIISDMNAGHPLGGSPVGSQIGYWKFDEGYGSKAYDSSPLKIDGTISTASYTNDGRFGKALYFNGASYVTLGNISGYKIDNKTVSFWANPTVSPGGTVVLFGNGGSNWYVGLTTSNRIITSHTVTAGTQQTTLSPTNTVSINEWHYYSVSWTVSGSNVTVTMYKDGTQVSSTAYTTGYGSVYGSNFILGGLNSGANLYTGYLDEVKLYGGVLSSSEIKADYNRGSSLVLGGAGVNTSDGKTSSGSASTAYCVPGDTSTCSAPVGEWKFDEHSGTTANDSSGNGNSATLTSASWTQGYSGTAVAFNGSSSYVSAATSSSIDMTTNDFTLQAWIKTTSTSQQRVISKRSAGNIGYELLLLSTGKLDFFIGDSGGFTFSGLDTTAVNDGKWHLITAVFNRSGNVVSYIDGRQDDAVSISTRTGSISSATSLFIGRYSVSSSQFFNGSIDEPRIYNYARTPAQIAYDYNRGKAVMWLKMDDCQGATVHDASGNGLDGTITIGATGTQTSVGTCATASTAWGNGATGKFNSSLNFDNTDDYVSVPDPASGILDFGTRDFSLSVWTYRTSSSGTDIIIGKRVYPPGYVIYYSGTSLVMQVNDASAHSYTLGTISDINTWHQITTVVKRSTNQLLYYLDGKLKNTVDISATTGSLDNAGYFGIGRDQSDATNLFAGQIDDVQVFNYPLTLSQVQNIYNQNSSIRFGP